MTLLTIAIVASLDFVGDTHGAKSFTVLQGGSPFDLTGATLTCRLNSADPSQPGRVGTGTFTVTDALGGKCTYAPSAADVSAVGLFQFQIVFAYPDGSQRHSNVVIWRVSQPL